MNRFGCVWVEGTGEHGLSLPECERGLVERHLEKGPLACIQQVVLTAPGRDLIAIRALTRLRRGSYWSTPTASPGLIRSAYFRSRSRRRSSLALFSQSPSAPRFVKHSNPSVLRCGITTTLGTVDSGGQVELNDDPEKAFIRLQGDLRDTISSEELTIPTPPQK
jgi:hypothetical protein